MKRVALIIGNTEYEDATVKRLVSPRADVEQLASVLSDPDIGAFDAVLPLMNPSHSEGSRAIQRFLKDCRLDDLVVLYFSGHGDLDVSSRLHLLVKDTDSELLEASSIPARFITEQLDRCFSRRQVLILDCCYSGAVADGAKSSAPASVKTGAVFVRPGYGRYVLTASDAITPALEGDALSGQASPSKFTRYLIEGLRTGEADRDQDGWIGLGELSDYVHDRVTENVSGQVPSLFVHDRRGEIFLAKNPGPVFAPLDSQTQDLLESSYADTREASLRELGRWLASDHRGRRATALRELERLRDHDEDERVSALAAEVLARHSHHPEASWPRPSLASVPRVTASTSPPPNSPSSTAEPRPPLDNTARDPSLPALADTPFVPVSGAVQVAPTTGGSRAPARARPMVRAKKLLTSVATNVETSPQTGVAMKGNIRDAGATTVVVHPKLAPAGHARFWVGVFNRREHPAAPPRLRFGGDGVGVTPVVVRPLSAFRAGALAGKMDEPRTFTGVYEFPRPPGQAKFVLRVGVTGEAGEAVAEAAPFPVHLPSETPVPAFNILLASCFYHKGDHSQAIAAVVAALPASSRPHLTLFLGDQVYLDQPTLAEYPNDAPWLAAAFEARYSSVWRGPYGAALRLAPSVCIPDDHEFWNNYPQSFVAAQNTWTPEGRRRWDRAARGAFGAFQLGDGGAQGAPVVFDVPPLSFFVADTRSNRGSEGRRATLGAAGLRRLSEWARSAVESQRYPVFVAGQSLFDRPGSGVDRNLPDFEDYTEIMRELGQLSQHGRCPLLITGDVHYGRLAYAVDAASGRPRAFEIISSPSALVDTLGADLWNQLTRSGPWPKHPAPKDPPARVRAGAATWELRTAHKQAGNHVALLSFRRFAGGVQFKVSYWPVHSREALRKPTELGWVDLKSRE